MYISKIVNCVQTISGYDTSSLFSVTSDKCRFCKLLLVCLTLKPNTASIKYVFDKVPSAK